MQKLEFASLVARLGASVTDRLFVGIPCLAIWLVGTICVHLTFVWTLICLTVGIVYSVGFQASAWQATPGMRLAKIYIVRAKGAGRVSFARALARYFVYNLVFLFFVSLLWLNPANPHNFIGKAAERYDALYLKEQRGERMTPAEKQILYPAYAAVGLARRALPIGVLVNSVYMSFLAGMIGYSRRKTGLHDLVCGTQVVCQSDHPEWISARGAKPP